MDDLICNSYRILNLTPKAARVEMDRAYQKKKRELRAGNEGWERLKEADGVYPKSTVVPPVQAVGSVKKILLSIYPGKSRPLTKGRRWGRIMRPPTGSPRKNRKRQCPLYFFLKIFPR